MQPRKARSLNNMRMVYNGSQGSTIFYPISPLVPLSPLIYVQITVCVCVCACAKSLQSCPTLCDPIDQRLPGCSVHGILQARVLEWVAMSSSRGSSQPRDQIQVSHIAASCNSLSSEAPGKPLYIVICSYFYIYVCI